MSAGKLFDIQGDTVIPKQDCYIIMPIKDAIDKYGTIICAYLHYMKSMRPSDNPYADVPISERSDQLMFDLGITLEEDDPVISTALQCVEEKYYTTFYGVYRGMKSMLDKIGLKLLSEEPSFDKKEGNSDSIKGWIKDYESLRKSFKIAFKDFEEEEGDMKVRGGGALADDEDENY